MSAYQDYSLIINESNVTSGNKTSAWQDAATMEGFGIHEESGGTLAGTLSLEVRGHADLTPVPVTQIVFAAVAAASPQYVNVSKLRAKEFRIVFTYGSGSGSLKVAVFGKGN